MDTEKHPEGDDMRTLEGGCRDCGGDQVSEQTDTGRRLVCVRCGSAVAVAPVLGVWPFAASVSPGGADSPIPA